MSNVVYVSNSHIERREGPPSHRETARRPVIFSVHGAIAEHYKIDPAKVKESEFARCSEHELRVTNALLNVMIVDEVTK